MSGDSFAMFMENSSSLYSCFHSKLKFMFSFSCRQVFNHFLFGFPPHWEEYAEKCFEGGSTSGFVPRSNPGVVSISTHDLDKLMMDSESNICSIISFESYSIMNFLVQSQEFCLNYVKFSIFSFSYVNWEW